MNGYYFPDSNRVTSVMRVEPTWVLKFIMSRACLPGPAVVTSFKRDLEREVGGLSAGTPCKLCTIIYFLSEKFGRRACLVASGQSVVILDPDGDRVFKHMLRSEEALGATMLLSKWQAGEVQLEQSLLPMDVVEENYIIYTCYLNRCVDIRLKNICFHPDRHRVMLIDLARSKSHAFPHHHFPPFQPCPDTYWILEKVDLMQLGLIFCYILDRSIDRKCV